MSYDVTLEYTGLIVDSFNPTYNYRAMLEEALDLHGVEGSLGGEKSPLHHMYFQDALPLFERGLQRLKNDPIKYRELEPENGWGTYHGLIDLFTKFIEVMKEHPDGTLRWN